ncbi:DUF4381 domain-containing protein [Mesorhizobium delmotii]|uniref:Uncharacterized protein n=1 Tax=Mesorhizobium delmotii TaxID=1631247 RepID=A0A2P9AU34_9HYPH|nr:DUF4381 domain-containing protein [Mesorhizobium delmotii]SJM34660.1 hypothetical protein BQ8482_480143 [Mesorhizobium delmotii]
MSSSDKMGEIIRVNLRVDPNAIANLAALLKQGRVHSGMKWRSWLSRTLSQGLFASGLRARFEAFWLSPEIEAEDLHSNSEVVKDFSKSSKQCAPDEQKKCIEMPVNFV